MMRHELIARYCLLGMLGMAPVLLGRCEQRAVITVVVEGLNDAPDIRALALTANLDGRRLSVRLPAQVETRVALLPNAIGKLTVDVAGLRANDCSVATGRAEATVTGTDSLRIDVRLSSKICNEACFCWENPLPMGNALNRTWGSSANDVWAVGAAGTIRHWNGRIWEPPSPPITSENLLALWGSGPNAIWAAGTNGIIAHYNGFAWQIQPSHVTTYFSDVWGSGPDDVWAVGGEGTVLRREGLTWKPMTLPVLPPDAGKPTEESFAAISGNGPDNVWIAGTYTLKAKGYVTSLLHFDHGTWIREPSPPVPPEVMQTRPGSLWVSPAGDVWLAHAHHVPLGPNMNEFRLSIQRRRAGQTTWDTIPSPPGTGVRRIRGGPEGEPWLVGTDVPDPVPFWSQAEGRGIVWRWNGSAWQRIDSTATQAKDGLNDIWLSAEGNFWAVGDNAAVVANQLGHWTRGPQGSTRRVNALWASRPQEIWAVGDFGSILRWDGEVWTELTLPSGTENFMLNDVFGLSADDLWAVGYDQDSKRGAVMRYDGVAWRLDEAAHAPALSGVSLDAVWGRNSREIWSVGQSADQGSSLRGFILLRDGDTWRQDPAVKALDLTGIYMCGVWGLDGQVFATGFKDMNHIPQSTIYRLDAPGPWVVETTLERTKLLRMRGGNSGDLWAVGSRTVMVLEDGKPTDTTLGAAYHHPPASDSKGGWKDLSGGFAQHKYLELTDVHVSRAGDVWFSGRIPETVGTGCASGYRGVMLHHTDGQWELMPTGAANEITSVVATDVGEVWAAGGGGAILHRRTVPGTQAASPDGGAGP